MSLETLIDRQQLWRGSENITQARSVIASRFEALDQPLGGGFPLGALSELLIDQHSSCAMRLMMHSLAELSQQGRWITLIAPPYLPYAPALANHGIDISRILLVHPKSNDDTLWAMEQALRAGTCGAVLAWPTHTNERQLRRLQLAAEQGNAMAVLLQRHQAEKRSPAALRLKVRPHCEGAQVEILKRRGGWPYGPILLNWNHANHVPAQSAPVVWPLAAATLPGYLPAHAMR